MVAASDGSSMHASMPVYDVRTLDSLRAQAQRNPGTEATQQQVAREFESLFINMMLQRMREATPREGLFDTQQTRMLESLADQQLASALADPGIGLAQALLRQMQAHGRGAELQEAAPADALDPGWPDGSKLEATDDAMTGRVTGLDSLFDVLRAPQRAAVTPGKAEGAGAVPDRVADFVARMQPVAQQVAQLTGVPLKLMLGQAALESGWGRREINHADGRPSHNLFGIKADASWRGASVEVSTTEFVDGVARKIKQRFRAYDSYAQAFADYAQLLAGSPRYAQVLTAGDHQEAARRVQQAGYATDPHYAEKLIRVMDMMEG
jgi:flagellar protein FlgJ